MNLSEGLTERNTTISRSVKNKLLLDYEGASASVATFVRNLRVANPISSVIVVPPHRRVVSDLRSGSAATIRMDSSSYNSTDVTICVPSHVMPKEIAVVPIDDIVVTALNELSNRPIRAAIISAFIAE